MESQLSFPIKVTFHGVERSAPLQELVESHVSRLPRFHPRIHGVDVVLTRGEGHHERGNRWRVQVRVAIPGNDVIVGHHHGRHADHEDPFICVSDAFRAVERRLTDDASVRRGEVKARAIDRD